jgi:hypothetical protein
MDTKILTEEQRQQLDLIVHKMTRAGEKPTAIQYVVSDFKNKYGSAPAPDPGFREKFVQGAKNIGKDILGIEQNKSTSFIPSLLRSTIGSQGLAGIAQMPGRVAYQAMNPDEEIITPRQALGTTINAGLTVATSGTGSLASKTGLTGAKALGARAAEFSAIGAGSQVGLNLAEKKPITENLGLSTALGGALPIAGTGLVKGKQALLNQAMPEAERVINSLIKPLQKDFAYGKNPARGILNEGIVANSFEDLNQKVAEKRSQVGGRIGELGRKLSQFDQISLDLTPALAPIDEAIRKAAKSNNPTLFNSLNNVKVALLYNLEVGEEKGVPAIIQGSPKNLISAGYEEAKQFLDDIAEHTRYTGNPSDDKALNKATRDAYSVVREAMNQGADSVNPKFGTEIRNLNERYGDLLSAQSAINHRDIVMKRQNYLDLAQKFSIPISIGAALMSGLSSGNWSHAGAILATEAVGLAASKGLASTASKTRIAQFLSKLAPEERVGILNSTPVLKNLWERLTGQVEPEAGAPKTKALQTVEDYIKNPKLGLSMEDVSYRQGEPLSSSGPRFEAQVQDLVQRMADKDISGARNWPDKVAKEIRGELRDRALNLKATSLSEPRRTEIYQDLLGKKLNALIPRDKSLAGVDAKLQEASIDKYVKNRESLVKEYLATNEKVVNADEAKKLFTDLGYSGSNAAAVHEASSNIAKDAWRQLLKTTKSEDSLLTIGGSGTGKSTAVKNFLPEEIAKAGAIWDGNLSSLKSAKARIQESLAAGVHPNLVYVYRDPIGSWVDGVIKRMLNNPDEGGRVVPLSVFLENHKGSYNVAKSLLNDEALGIKYDLKLVDNSFGEGKQKLMDRAKFDSINYESGLKEKLMAQTKKLYDNGTISKEQYEALIK